MKLKNFLYSCAAFSLLLACNNTTKTEDTTSDTSSTHAVATTGKGKISFTQDTYEFGVVKEGQVVQHDFTFTNEGSEPVILAAVNASCGCTTPDYTKEPILPGKAGVIKVSFNSHGQVGTQEKIVTISSNAENHVTTVRIKGVVEK